MFIPIPRSIKKMLAVFRGGVAPPLIFLSVMLGFWFGLVPGWSGLHTVLVILFLILNIHTALFLLSAAIGKGLLFAAAPVLYHIGVFAQDHISWLFKLLASVPLVGITDFTRYSVAGAVVVGPVIGAIAGLLLARAVIGFRKTLLRFEENSEAFKKWYSHRWVRIIDRLLVGKRTKDAQSLFTGRTVYIRKAGVVLALIVIIVSAVAVNMVKDETVREYAVNRMTQANGAEVNLASLALSLLTGAVSAAGIQVTDADSPENNFVAIEKLSADASLYNILLGKLVLDNLEVTNISFDEKRRTPGKVVTKSSEEKEAVFDPGEFKIEVADIAKLENYFKDAKALKENLARLRRFLPKPKDEKQAAARQVPLKHLEYLGARSQEPATPRLLARNMLLDKIEIPSVMFGNSAITLKNISDSPRTAGLPIDIEIGSHDTGAEVKVTVDFDSAAGPAKLSGIFSGFDLAKFQSGLGERAGLAFQSGLAAGSFNGQISAQTVDLSIAVNIKNLKATSQGDGILGLGANHTRRILDTLKDLNTTIRVVGPVTEPRVAFDTKGLTEQFRQALIDAGRERFAQELDGQIQKQLGDKLPDEVKEAVKPKGLLEALGGLLGGKKEEQ